MSATAGVTCRARPPSFDHRSRCRYSACNSSRTVPTRPPLSPRGLGRGSRPAAAAGRAALGRDPRRPRRSQPQTAMSWRWSATVRCQRSPPLACGPLTHSRRLSHRALHAMASGTTVAPDSRAPRRRRLGGRSLWGIPSTVQRGRQIVDDARPERVPMKNLGSQDIVQLNVENRGKGQSRTRRLGFTGVPVIETRDEAPVGQSRLTARFNVLPGVRAFKEKRRPQFKAH